MSDQYLTNAVDDDRIAAAVDDYLLAKEQGRAVDQSEFLAQHPDIADELRQCLQGVDFVQRAAAGFNEPQAAAVPINRTLGDFRLLRELGRGGMGVVYEAEQLSLGRPVALKVLPYAALLDNRQLERFKNEARAAAMLKHPHIVSVHAVGSARSVHYYAMELIRGRSLEEVIGALRRGEEETSETSAEERRRADDTVLPRALNRRSEEAVPGEGSPGADTAAVAELSTLRSGDRKGYYRSVAELGLQAAEALEYAHGEGVIHRDVKPSNLMLDEAGRLHVTDFGLARVQNVEALTMTGDVLGTLRYMSPEQAEGRYVDHRSDVYSLGVTLYELATLRPALDGKDRRELLRRLAESQPKPPREVDPRIPRDLETVILKAMAPAAEERYETAQELADDLRRFLASEPVLAQRPGPWRHLVRWVGRNRVVASLIACSLVLLTALAIGGPIVAVDAAAAKARAEAHQADLQRLLTETLGETIVALENTSGVDDLLERLVNEALEQFDALMASDDLTPEQRRNLAASLTRIARVVEFRFDHSRAMELGKIALAELEEVHNRLPNDPETQLALSLCSFFLGVNEDDLSLAHRSISAAEQVVQAAPHVVRNQEHLLWSQTFLGVVQMHHGRYSESEATLEHAISAWRRLAAEHPDKPDLIVGIGHSLWMLGALRMGDRRPAEAESPLREVVSTPWEMLEDPKLSMPGRNHVGLAHLRLPLARSLLLQRRPEEAEPLLLEGLHHLTPLRTDFPRSGWVRAALHEQRNLMSDLLRDRGRYEEAIAVLGDTPNNQGLYRLGVLQLIRGNDDAAMATLAQALANLEATADMKSDYMRLSYYFATCPLESLRAPPKSLEYIEAARKSSARREWRLEGIVLHGNAKYREAAEAFEKAITQNHGGDAADFFWAAINCQRLGEEAKARRWYDRGLEYLDQPLVGGYIETEWELERLRAEAESVLSTTSAATP